jgi:Ca2+/Na+ antiporter
MGILGFLILLGIAVYLYKTYYSSSTYETRDERYNAERARRQKELDQLLDKISKRGMDSLSEHERRRLDELSGKR